MPVFLFGTLRDTGLLSAVLGAKLPVQAAALADHVVIDRGGYPVLVPKVGPSADGIILHPDATQLAALDFYEGLFGYRRQTAHLQDGQMVWVYSPDSSPDDRPDTHPWVLADWVARHGAAAILATQEVMALRTHHPPEHLAVRYPMIMSHAAARLRARHEAAPANVRRGAEPGDVASLSKIQPYAYFFGVQSDDLRFRQFNGAHSPVVRRAGFLMSDAVTVLPYDPATDSVLLVEQFRYGLYLRDAPNCWSLEAIAGRIDPGETPSDAALREAAEEAGLTLHPDALQFIGQAYPSPGSISECLFQYVALCDLPENDGAIGGLETENEDIRRHVISFDRLMGLCQTGEAQNGPLLTSAYWLALNRDRFRR
jgi:nudix-type nucleoside diphosphatase (YffH/AdpP family)